MNDTVVIDGVVDLISIIDGELSLDQECAGEVGAFMAIRDGAYPVYEGPTTVIPKIATEQILETKNRSLLDDIEVTRIPVHTTANPSGGNTVYIGGDISYV